MKIRAFGSYFVGKPPLNMQHLLKMRTSPLNKRFFLIFKINTSFDKRYSRTIRKLETKNELQSTFKKNLTMWGLIFINVL